MRCAQCGTELPADSRFCARCGHPVETAVPATPAVAATPAPGAPAAPGAIAAPRKGVSPLVVLAIAGAVVALVLFLVVIAGGAYFLLTRSSGPPRQAGPVPAPPSPARPSAPQQPSPPSTPAPPAQPMPSQPAPPGTPLPSPQAPTASPGPQQILPLAAFRHPRGLFQMRYPDGWKVEQNDQGQFFTTQFFAEDPERFSFTIQIGPVEGMQTPRDALQILIGQARQVYPDFRADEADLASGSDRSTTAVGARWTNRRGEAVTGVLVARLVGIQREGRPGTMAILMYFYAPQTSMGALLPTYSAMLQSFSLGSR
jgi:zinc ribbon protein